MAVEGANMTEYIDEEVNTHRVIACYSFMHTAGTNPVTRSDGMPMTAHMLVAKHACVTYRQNVHAQFSSVLDGVQ